MADDYYRVLGVSRDATAEDIQRAYRKLARRAHPDVNKEPGAEERFKEITEAYHVLSDPGSRRKYDRFGERWRQVPDDFERQDRRTGRRYARTGTGPRGGVEFDIGLDDLLGSIFGGRGGGFGRGPVQGADAEAELTIRLEDAYRGGDRTVTLPGGGGRDPRRYEVTIPRGITEGQRIRLPGQGSGGLGGGPAGDLYLVVHIAEDSRYKVSGRDVTVQLPVTPWEAALGATVPLRTPGGEKRVGVPPGSSSGRRLRLRGQGLPNPRGDPGDLYAEIRIMVPPKPAAQELRLFEELSRTSSFDPRSTE
ncbi:DnaJ C-terminal domain-containing protein [Dactylosporangium sp. CA-092794]|uniref:DnaJ C-terminal domain-containing protein n=1 Tax=Dactylosporangium sp. CA-092794 TaxID=3239929 RepID=UPI003D8B122C